MAKMTVEIEWDGGVLGPAWMNEDNLKSLLFSREYTFEHLVNLRVLPGGRDAAQFAGAVFGFGAYLTTRPGVMEVGESQCAASMADACKEYLESFGVTDEVEPDIPHFCQVGPTVAGGRGKS